MSVVTLPTSILPARQSLTPDGPGQKMKQSEFSAAQTVVNYAGNERWKLQLSYINLTDDERAEVMGFATRLRIGVHEALIINHTAPQRGALTQSPTSRATGTANTAGVVVLNIADGGVSVSSWARRGDWLSVNCELKMVLNDVGTDGSEEAALDIWPPLRSTVVSGTQIVVTNPAGLFRMTRPANFVTVPPGFRTSITMEFVEHVNSSKVVDL